MGTRRWGTHTLQRPVVTAFGAQLQQQSPKQFQQRPRVRAAATFATFQQQSRLFAAAALLQCAAVALVLGAANVFRPEPQLSSSVSFLLRTVLFRSQPRL